ncbi:hypothetical protein D3C76_1769790 [compost metagenome]
MQADLLHVVYKALMPLYTFQAEEVRDLPGKNNDSYPRRKADGHGLRNELD